MYNYIYGKELYNIYFTVYIIYIYYILQHIDCVTVKYINRIYRRSSYGNEPIVVEEQLMQTFLPYEDFHMSAQCLDDKRLYKQIVECKQILAALSLKKSKLILQLKNLKIAYENHPAVLMWEGHESELRYYQWCCLREWIQRRWDFVVNIAPICPTYSLYSTRHRFPFWLGIERFHKSHRLNLLFKNPEHYSQYFDEEVPTEKPEYVWPVQKVSK